MDTEIQFFFKLKKDNNSVIKLQLDKDADRHFRDQPKEGVNRIDDYEIRDGVAFETPHTFQPSNGTRVNYLSIHTYILYNLHFLTSSNIIIIGICLIIYYLLIRLAGMEAFPMLV